MLTGCYFELSRSLLHLRARGENSWAHVECWPSQHKERRAKGVCSGRTQDTGWQVLLDGCRERRDWRSPHGLACQHQDLEFDTSSHGQLDAHISSVCACLHVCVCVCKASPLASPGRQIRTFCHIPQHLVQMLRVPFNICMRGTSCKRTPKPIRQNETIRASAPPKVAHRERQSPTRGRRRGWVVCHTQDLHPGERGLHQFKTKSGSLCTSNTGAKCLGCLVCLYETPRSTLWDSLIQLTSSLMDARVLDSFFFRSNSLNEPASTTRTEGQKYVPIFSSLNIDVHEFISLKQSRK